MKRLVCILLIAVLLCACANTSGAAAKEYGADFAKRVEAAWKEQGYL